MNRRLIVLIAAAAAVVVLVGIGWYVVTRPTGQQTVTPPPTSIPAESPTPSPTPSPSPSDRSPSPTGSPSLPGIPAVNANPLQGLPFRVVRPANWTCKTDSARLDGVGYECANSSDAAKVTARLRLIWRPCPDDCDSVRKNVLTVDWQVAWFGEVRRMVPVDPDTATLEAQSTRYFAALSRFTKSDDSPYHYAVVVEGPVADRALLAAMTTDIRTNAG